MKRYKLNGTNENGPFYRNLSKHPQLSIFHHFDFKANLLHFIKIINVDELRTFFDIKHCYRSLHTLIFFTKNVFKIFWGWELKKSDFLLNDVKSPWINGLQSDVNFLIGGLFWQISIKNPVLGTLLTFNFLSMSAIKFSCQNAPFKCPFDYSLSEDYGSDQTLWTSTTRNAWNDLFHT